MKHRDRKPDLETESFRAWKTTKEETKEIKEIKEKHPIWIKIDKNRKFQLCGFTKAINKDTNEVVFAYKFKSENKTILFYMAENLSEKAKKKVTILKTIIEKNPMGYLLIDARDWVKRISNEEHVLKKLGKQNG